MHQCLNIIRHDGGAHGDVDDRVPFDTVHVETSRNANDGMARAGQTSVSAIARLEKVCF